MGTIHHIDGDEIADTSGVNEFCLEGARTLLEKAVNGEVVGFNISMQHADGATSGYTCGFVYNSRIVGELMTHIIRLSK